jgi:hypothetical protein
MKGREVHPCPSLCHLFTVEDEVVELFAHDSLHWLVDFTLTCSPGTSTRMRELFNNLVRWCSRGCLPAAHRVAVVIRFVAFERGGLGAGVFIAPTTASHKKGANHQQEPFHFSLLIYRPSLILRAR